MFNRVSLQAVLGIWALWHLVFGLLSTLAPETGGELTGWVPQAGWSDDLVAMSTQYGMAMLVLAAVYAVMAIDPIRYLALIWVAVIEQVLGIIYALYLYQSVGDLTLPQVATQAAINVIIIAVFLMFLRKLREPAATMAE